LGDVWTNRRVTSFGKTVCLDLEKAQRVPVRKLNRLFAGAGVVRDVHRAQRIGADVDLHDLVPVVGHVEVHVREQVIPHFSVCVWFQDLLDLPHETPNRQVVVEHLEIVILLHGFSEFFQIRLRQRLAAQTLVLLVHPERYVVRRARHPVAL
jgi:hypothetical protein|tara:strand:+ start:2230 stop:2685 length:456 start_codon:yes stop_codon:yes gene_type:complete